MDGRRQARAGLALFLLAIVLPAVTLAFGAGPSAAVPAGTLVAATLLFSALMMRAAVAPVPALVRVRANGTTTSGTPVLLRMVDPDAPGRPRPRAPGRGPDARA